MGLEETILSVGKQVSKTVGTSYDSTPGPEDIKQQVGGDRLGEDRLGALTKEPTYTVMSEEVLASTETTGTELSPSTYLAAFYRLIGQFSTTASVVGLLDITVEDIEGEQRLSVALSGEAINEVQLEGHINR